jgi:phosphatidylglycerophosphatase A
MLLLEAFGGWEVILIIAVLLILFGARHLPGLGRGLGEGIEQFRKAADEVTSQIRDAANPDGSHDSYGRFSLRVFIAQGFGVGKIPFAPGTFGSFAALLWFALLVWTGNLWTYLACAVEGIAFSLWLCDDAEKILGEEDPSSVVLDEIIAIPFCFLPWIASEWWRHDALPPVSHFLSGSALWMTLGIVGLFRVFDIWKPWPVRQSQRLPGGWGVTVDDLLAAVYVALLSIPFVVWLT